MRRSILTTTLAGLLGVLLTAAEATAGCGGCGGGGTYTTSGASYQAASQGYFVSGPIAGPAAQGGPVASAPAAAAAGYPVCSTYAPASTGYGRPAYAYRMPYSYRR